MAMRGLITLGVLASLLAPGAAMAMSLPEAIALAQRGNPGLAQSKAQAAAAAARLEQARGARLPSLTLSGEAGQGTTDLGGFFGFGKSDVSPRSAALQLSQPLYAGGAINAAIDRARGGRDAALAQVGGARALLAAEAAQAYVGVLSAQEMLSLHTAQMAQMEEIARQAQLRFKGGETPRTDLAQAQARLAEARAGLARAEGDIARSRAHFVTIIGVEADGLEALPEPPTTPLTLDEAVAQASQASPALLAAEARLRAAEAGARYAQADRLPNLAIAATASSARDQFFPGYRSDGVTIGVQGRWTLFSGGVISGRVNEARAELQAARFALEATRAQVREAVISGWGDVATARAVAAASTEQVTAAVSALDSVRNEVRVGQKPTLDLLDAEREALGARSASVVARGDAVVAAYRLNALLHAQ